MSTAGFVISNPRFKAFIQGTNAPLSGGLAYFYLTGTAQSTLQPVFAEIACLTPLTNPVVLDVNGEANIFGNAIYDIVLKDSNNVSQDTILGVSFSPAAATGIAGAPEWLQQTGALTYLTVTTFTIAGDQTSLFHPGRRIQVKVTAGNLFGTIVSSAFTTSTTVTVSLDSGSLDSGLNTGSVWIGMLNSQKTSIPTLNPLPTTTGGPTIYLLTVQRGDLIAGTRIQAIINATNTGASTLATNSGPATPIKKQGATALIAGDMLINSVADLEFDGTNWQLLNPGTAVAGSITGTQIANATITQANMAATSVGTAQLKTATGTVTVTSAIGLNLITMNALSFFPSITESNADGSPVPLYPQWPSADPSDFVGRFAVGATNHSHVRWQYITASDNPEIWVMFDADGLIKGIWVSDDPIADNACPLQNPNLTSVRISRQNLEILLPLCSKESLDAPSSSSDRRAFRSLEKEFGSGKIGQVIMDNCKIVNGKLALK